MLTSMDLQPDEKPLRSKRGHRKPDFLNDIEGGSMSYAHGAGLATHSPSGSDAFSHTNPAHPRAEPSNGHFVSPHPAIVKPKSAFEIYCNETRDSLIDYNRHTEGFDLERALAQGWQTLDEAKKGELQRRFELLKTGENAGNGVGHADEDVEMDERGTETEVAEETGGFTAINPQ